MSMSNDVAAGVYRHCSRRAEVLLPQRIEYLARAILCVKSGQSMVSLASQGEFLHELEEKMEVGHAGSALLTHRRRNISVAVDNTSGGTHKYNDLVQIQLTDMAVATLYFVTGL